MPLLLTLAALIATFLVSFFVGILVQTLAIRLAGRLCRIADVSLRRAIGISALLSLLLLAIGVGTSEPLCRDTVPGPGDHADMHAMLVPLIGIAVVLLATWCLLKWLLHTRWLKAAAASLLVLGLSTILGGGFAFLLASILRANLVEAFLTPTGAMAPTLLGVHGHVCCDICGLNYALNFSERMHNLHDRPPEPIPTSCPNCGRAALVLAHTPILRGDRFLVQKLLPPERWQLAVFNDPQDPSTRYVKRLIGLPGETIRIKHGQIWIKPSDLPMFTVARKPPDKIREMLQIVHDNDLVPRQLIDRGWPPRWAADAAERTAGAWATDDQRRFHADGSASGDAWLRYRHFFPAASDWQVIGDASAPPASLGHPRPQLITDSCAYNSSAHNDVATAETLGLHWVGDLALGLSMHVQSQTGTVLLELVKGGRRFQCAFDLATGAATLSIDGQDAFRPGASTAVRGPGTYKIMLANVDDQLTLWLDGRVVSFDSPTTYEPLGNDRPRPLDLSPVGIASRGAALSVDHLKILRDVYYIPFKQSEGSFARHTGSARDLLPPGPLTPETLTELLSNPARWEILQREEEADFQLNSGQFFMLGDNSVRSKDSRFFGPVQGQAIVGTAQCIYWPPSRWCTFY